MTTRLLILTILFSACGQKTEKHSALQSDLKDSIPKDTFVITQVDTNKFKSNQADTYEFITERTDSVDLINFWNYAVVPILKKNKKIVLTTVHFPLMGDWAQMVGLNKYSEDASPNEFLLNYDKLFNKDFIEQLSLQTYKDLEVSTYKDTLYFSFGVGKSKNGFESSVRLQYKKFNDQFKLISIHGAGGDFYEE